VKNILTAFLITNKTTTTMPLQKPKNQHALAIRLLIDYGSKGVTMKDAVKDYFYKFNTRLNEVEKAHPKLKVRRLRMNAKNRFGHSVSFLNYKSIAPTKYLINLYNVLNKEK